MSAMTRRDFLGHLESAAAAGVLGLTGGASAQTPGDRPIQAADVVVLNPGTRVPVGLIIDDSTCLVNLNRFAMPQFDEAFGGSNKVYARDWKSWPVEIPDSFVRRFGTWCAEHGVKGKYSIVPYPACVGRLDRGLPGWSRRELDDSLALVRTLMLPNWDIHPEMVTHTRVIDLATGHPYADHSPKFMENWEWTTGRSADELAAYLAYALRILREVGLPCEGVTTPGGFGAKVRPSCRRDAAGRARRLQGGDPALLPARDRRRGPGASRRASRTRAASTAPIPSASSASSPARTTGPAAGTTRRPAAPIRSSHPTSRRAAWSR